MSLKLLFKILSVNLIIIKEKLLRRKRFEQSRKEKKENVESARKHRNIFKNQKACIGKR